MYVCEIYDSKILRQWNNEVSRDDILGKDYECVVVQLHNMLHSMYFILWNAISHT